MLKICLWRYKLIKYYRTKPSNNILFCLASKIGFSNECYFFERNCTPFQNSRSHHTQLGANIWNYSNARQKMYSSMHWFERYGLRKHWRHSRDNAQFSWSRLWSSGNLDSSCFFNHHVLSRSINYGKCSLKNRVCTMFGNGCVSKLSQSQGLLTGVL